MTGAFPSGLVLSGCVPAPRTYKTADKFNSIWVKPVHQDKTLGMRAFAHQQAANGRVSMLATDEYLRIFGETWGSAVDHDFHLEEIEFMLPVSDTFILNIKYEQREATPKISNFGWRFYISEFVTFRSMPVY